MYKSAQEKAYISPLKNLPVGSLERSKMTFRSTDATVIFLTVVPLIDCPVDRPALESGVLSFGRPRGRPAFYGWPVHISRAHRSTDLVDRPVGRQCSQAENLGLETKVIYYQLNPIKSH